MNAQTSKPKPAAKAASTAKTAASKAAAKAPVKSSAKTAPAPKDVRPTPAPAPVSSGGVLRSPRPSSRLTQLTVPSMAQSVASTAAKSSYSTPAPSQVQMVAPAAPPKKDSKLANNWKTKSAEELSDAEILAMPDSEYMNEKQVAFFRHKLVLLKQDMHNNAGETTEHLREDTVVVPDPADRATIEEEHALELRTRDRERKLLKKIEQSIARIDAGEYGYCDETGEPIGVGRLLARPTATLSLEAQQRRELKQKMFGD
ncbi:MAG: RNA polymerase-binding protein DksA [Burkholderiaceae bacterium]|nr:RNA polymerase-binding protein DksA [Burkholderiaceae bacterium]